MSTLANGNCPLSNGVTENVVKNKFEQPSFFDSKEELVYVSPLNGEKFVIPDAPTKCTWTKDARKEGVFCPHTTQNW